MKGGRGLPRLLRGGHAFVVKVAWEGLQDADSTWESVSCFFHDALAVLGNNLTALALRVKRRRGGRSNSGMGFVFCELLVVWGGGGGF